MNQRVLGPHLDEEDQRQMIKHQITRGMNLDHTLLNKKKSTSQIPFILQQKHDIRALQEELQSKTQLLQTQVAQPVEIPTKVDRAGKRPALCCFVSDVSIAGKSPR